LTYADLALSPKRSGDAEIEEFCLKRFDNGLVLSLAGSLMRLGSRRECDLIVDAPTVSRSHAILKRVEGTWVVQDSGSTNGTWVNGRKISSLTYLVVDDHISFGAAHFFFLKRGQAMIAAQALGCSTIKARRAENDLIVATGYGFDGVPLATTTQAGARQLADALLIAPKLEPLIKQNGNPGAIEALIGKWRAPPEQDAEWSWGFALYCKKPATDLGVSFQQRLPIIISMELRGKIGRASRLGRTSSIAALARHDTQERG
jgi:hypothetical protein